MWRHIISTLLTVVLFLAMGSLAEACPTCKQALAGQARYGNLPQAYMWSILFMMSMPFLLLGSFGGYMYMQIKKAQRERAAATSTSSTEVQESRHHETVEV